ncbi:MAG: hypothetical protein JEZ00_19485 [Anaerolineaceae bacterium]|nr:hypothetical protein [Anaerolineaceae bacterium]
MGNSLRFEKVAIIPGERRALDSWAEFVDIDPNQWQRWYDLLHTNNHAENGLYILHDDGMILTVNPVNARKELGLPQKIEHPFEMAEKLYADWQKGPVAILNRKSMIESQNSIARSFVPGDDFFSYLIQIKDQLFSESHDGLVIYPQPWKSWELISPELPAKLARMIAPDGSRKSVILAIYQGQQLYAGVLIGLEDGLIKLITTLPEHENRSESFPVHEHVVHTDQWKSEIDRWLEFAILRFAPVTIGAMCQLDTFKRLGWGPVSWSKWYAALQDNEIIALPDQESIDTFVEKVKGNMEII